MKYSLGGLSFSSKDAIKRHVQSIFAKYEVGARLTDCDFVFVRDLLEWHPSASQKIGCGVDRIEVHIPEPWTSKGFLIARIDGSTTDFSYRICLQPKKAQAWVDYLAACRKAIVPQVSGFKIEAFRNREKVWCEVTESWLTWDDAHVDHFPVPFIDLVERFKTEQGLELESISYYGHGDNETFVALADPSLEKQWAEWHLKNAKLRVIDGRANSRLGAHGRTKTAAQQLIAKA